MRSKLFFLWCVIFLSTSSIILSQSSVTGAIDSNVFDEENSPLPGVTITLTSPSLMGARTGITGADGLFRFPSLPPGVYTIKAELQGLRTTIQENVVLTTTV